MRIERVEPILISVPYDHGAPGGKTWPTMNTLFVKVETDAGVTGWGEAFGFAISPLTRDAIATLIAPLCIGGDPSDVAAFMRSLGHRLHNLGRYGPVTFGLSGIDIALWDIAGKVAGQPIHQLLGGAKRERLPAYASLLRFGDPELVARNAAAALERGYRHVKLHERDVASVAAARRAIGADVPLMLDVNCAWTPDEALATARELVPFGLRWLEEPVWPPEDHAALQRIRAATHVPVAAGENACTPNDLQALARDGAVDVLQPSVTKIGGITAMRTILADAASAGVEVAPHSPYFGPGLIATLHLIAAMERDCVCERFSCDLEASPLGGWIEAPGGSMAVPTAPGLGITVDEQILARYRVA